MKFTIPLALVAMLSTIGTAQICVSVQSVKGTNRDITILDSLYTPATDLFSPDTVVKAWYEDFWKGLTEHLTKSEVDLEQLKKIWIAIYCSPSGTIEHFLYSLPEGRNSEFEKKFCHSVNEFLRRTKFGLKTTVPYTQCGTFIFNNKSTKHK
jgi:hypothetical protein